MATRNAYGEALAALGTRRGDVVALDGEVSNSTLSETFAKAHPDRYLEMFIAEQQMIAAAGGVQVRGWVPFASTFAAFLTRIGVNPLASAIIRAGRAIESDGFMLLGWKIDIPIGRSKTGNGTQIFLKIQ